MEFEVGGTYSSDHIRRRCGYGIRNMSDTAIGQSRVFQAYGLKIANHCWRYDKFTMQRVDKDQWKVLSFDGSRYPR